MSQLDLMYDLLLLSSQRLGQFVVLPPFGGADARSASLLHQLSLLEQVELELLLQLSQQRLQLFTTEVRQFFLLLLLIQQHTL